MKVLFGYFSSESNEHSRSLMTFDKFVFKFGEEAIQHVSCRNVFEDAGIELIPSIIARGHPHGLVTYDAFEFIRSRLLTEVKAHMHEIDGIYLFLHGASKVIGLEGGSAEHAFLRDIRKIVGPHMPIALVMDQHGNLSQELVDNVNILRCYRHSPHTDALETFAFVAEKFVDLLKNRRNMHPVYRKVPIIIGGEKSVSLDEPMLSINKMCDDAEKDARILSASFHIGYLRHDGDKLGCSVVVVPQREKYRAYAEEVADQIRAFAYSKRHEFHYHGNTGLPEEVLKKAVAHTGGTVFVTDSGDNVGSGGDGFNTFILQQILKLKDTNNKRYLISGIVDHNAFKELYGKEVGEHVSLRVGMDFDDLCKAVDVEGVIIAKGLPDEGYEHKKDMGTAITVQFDHAPVSVVILNDAIQFYEPQQYARCGITLEDYDVVVVKQGYISAEFDAYGDLCMMALTQGPTYQRSELLEFKQIYRPMWPYDDYELEDML
ncbi:MAG: M81 family metallopeptidase [Longicatena sp.]